MVKSYEIGQFVSKFNEIVQYRYYVGERSADHCLNVVAKTNQTNNNNAARDAAAALQHCTTVTMMMMMVVVAVEVDGDDEVDRVRSVILQGIFRCT